MTRRAQIYDDPRRLSVCRGRTGPRSRGSPASAALSSVLLPAHLPTLLRWLSRPSVAATRRIASEYFWCSYCPSDVKRLSPARLSQPEPPSSSRVARSGPDGRSTPRTCEARLRCSGRRSAGALRGSARTHARREATVRRARQSRCPEFKASEALRVTGGGRRRGARAMKCKPVRRDGGRMNL